jgi:hypothetical protein
LQAAYLDYVPPAKPVKQAVGYWKDKENQKKFFDQLATKWNIQKLEDWNNVTTPMVLKEKGNFIFQHYNGSLKQGANVSI